MNYWKDVIKSVLIAAGIIAVSWATAWGLYILYKFF